MPPHYWSFFLYCVHENVLVLLVYWLVRGVVGSRDLTVTHKWGLMIIRGQVWPFNLIHTGNEYGSWSYFTVGVTFASTVHKNGWLNCLKIVLEDSTWWTIMLCWLLLELFPVNKTSCIPKRKEKEKRGSFDLIFFQCLIIHLSAPFPTLILLLYFLRHVADLASYWEAWCWGLCRRHASTISESSV